MQLKAAIEVDVSNQLSLLKSGGDSRFENAGGQGRRRWTVLTGGGDRNDFPDKGAMEGGRQPFPPDAWRVWWPQAVALERTKRVLTWERRWKHEGWGAHDLFRRRGHVIVHILHQRNCLASRIPR